MAIAIGKFTRVLALLAAACFFLAGEDALAQEKHKYYFKAPPGATKFGQTQVLEVGDVPGHQMRLRSRSPSIPARLPSSRA
jgi:hypothetical protein